MTGLRCWDVPIEGPMQALLVGLPTCARYILLPLIAARTSYPWDFFATIGQNQWYSAQPVQCPMHV